MDQPCAQGLARQLEVANPWLGVTSEALSAGLIHSTRLTTASSHISSSITRSGRRSRDLLGWSGRSLRPRAENRLAIAMPNQAPGRGRGKPPRCRAARPVASASVGETVLVEVWSDVVCPWCYIGKRRFDAALAELADDPDFATPIDVVLPPVPARPDARRRGPRCRSLDAYARKFGGPERAAAIIDHVTERGRRRGPRVPPRPGAAGEHPPTPTGCCGGRRRSRPRRRPRRRSRSACWRPTSVDGADVGDPDVLVDAAAACRPRRRRRAPRSSTATRACEALAVGLALRRRRRHHRRADVRHRPPVVDPRRPGPGRVRPGAAPAAPSDVPAEPAARLAPRGGAPGRPPRPRPRLHPDRSLVGADRAELARRRLRGRRRRRARPRRLGDVAPTCSSRRRAARSHRRPGDVRRLLDGRPPGLHLAVARPDLVERLVLVSATAGIDDAARAGRPPGRRRALAPRSSATASPPSSTRWVAQPLFASLPPTPRSSTTAAATPPPAWRRACASPAPARSSRCGRSCRR